MPSVITKLHPYSLFAVKIEPRFREVRLSTGTALCVQRAGRTFLVTAGHNLSGRDSITNSPLSPTCAIPDCLSVWFHHQDTDEERWTELTLPLLDKKNKSLWLAPLNPAIDIAILEFSPRSALVPTLNLDKYSGLPSVAPGKHVHVIGYPLGEASHGHFPIWNTGSLATELVIDFKGLPSFLIDCTSRKGNSGSPVLAETGYMATATGFDREHHFPELSVLGIYTGRLDDRSDLGVVWKLPAIAQIIEARLRGQSPLRE